MINSGFWKFLSATIDNPSAQEVLDSSGGGDTNVAKSVWTIAVGVYLLAAAILPSFVTGIAVGKVRTLWLQQKNNWLTLEGESLRG